MHHKNWHWFYSPRTTLIYQKQGLLWRVWRHCSRAGYLGATPRYSYDTNRFNKPPDCIRATIICQGNWFLQMTGWTQHLYEEPFILQPPIDTSWILQYSSHCDQMHHIRHSIIEGTAIAVSDGSFLASHKMGSAVWIIETPDHIHQCKGRVHCPGPPNIQCPHCSKLMGILGIVTHIKHIWTCFNIIQGSIKIGCDRLGAIEAISAKVPIIKSS
jgi:hypothetical protein